MKWIHALLAFIHIPAIAQQLPMERMTRHLQAAGEISRTSRWQDAEREIFVRAFFEAGQQGLYYFSNHSPHHYDFLLLRNNDTFQVMNCDDFVEDYQLMDRTFTGAAQDSFDLRLLSIIRVYTYNRNYHPSPPRPNLRADPGEPIKLRYLPRTLPETAPFVFRTGSR